MKFRIIFILSILLALNTSYNKASERNILLIPLDSEQELMYYHNAPPFKQEQVNIEHYDCIQGLIAQNCLLLVPHHLMLNIILQATIVNDIVNKKISHEDFRKKLATFPNLAQLKIALLITSNLNN